MLFASRWILAPFYLGVAASLIVLLIKFIGELAQIALHAFSATESEVILGVLALVDLALTGSLIVIVIFSGYENFVSRIDHCGHKDWPAWMGTIDFISLKLKVLSSIVAISAIQLLKQFMAIKQASERELFWLVVIHVVFVSRAYCWRPPTASQPRAAATARPPSRTERATAAMQGFADAHPSAAPPRRVASKPGAPSAKGSLTRWRTRSLRTGS